MNCYFYTFGCKVNTCETAGMQSLLQNAGYTVVSQPEQADIFLFNSCTVTASGDSRLHHAMRKVRREHPDALLVLTGCYPQAYPEQAAAIPEADLIIGTKHRSRLPALLAQLCQNHARIAAVDSYARQDDFEVLPCDTMPDNTRAFLKIQDGCNCFCSYCIIPYTRGRVRSRRPEDVEEEVKILAEEGYKEIVLTGIHLTSYGIDFKDEGIDFLTLIKRLHEIDGIERIRFGSLEPRVITEEFASELSRLPKICPHFHLSLQSGCDDTLKRMNRHYTCEEYADRCEILRKHFRNPAITTDVIVGFPAEKDADFETTRRFLEKVHFYEMHVFPYSRRAGTRADRMPDQVPEPVKKERSAVLLKLEKKMSGEYRSSFVGTGQEILLEEPVTINDEVYMTGYTKEYVKAAIRLDGRDPKTLKNTFVSGILGDFLTEEILLLKEK